VGSPAEPALGWRTACPDWAARIRAGRSLVPDLPLIKAEADCAVEIFSRLRLPDVPGQPELRTAAGEWQRDMVRALFGSYDPARNVRHIREIFAMVPKKSSKTTAGAAIMTTALLMNRRPRAEFLLIAPTQEISDLAYRQAVGMIEADPVLAAKVHIREHLKTIIFRPTGAFLKVKSFDPKVVTGSKPAGVLLDELHVIAEAPNADRVIGQLRGGLISQPEGFLVTITTQSERAPAGVFKAELKTARDVRDGKLQAPILPLIYEFPPDIMASDAWRDPANWPMVTPNNGLSITVERLVDEFNQAEAKGEAEFRRWATQHLNIELGVATADDSWPGAQYWERRADPTLTLDTLIERCDVAVVGIDGGGRDDLLGLAVIGRERGTRRWLVWCRAWCVRNVLDIRKSIASTLRDFEAAGTLRIIDNESAEDVVEVADIVERLDREGLLPDRHAIGVDPSGIVEIVDELRSRGFDAAEDGNGRVVGVSQGYRLNGIIKTCERQVATGGLVHEGSGLMNWVVGNAKVEARGNAVLITKQASGTAKIDPLMAMFNAADLMSRNPAPALVPEMFAI